MEAENTSSPLGQWQAQSLLSGHTGSGYLRFDGNTFLTGAPNSPLEYTFTIHQAGVYYLHLHCAKETQIINGETRTDVSNDAYVRVEGDYNAGSPPHDSHGDNASLELLKTDTKYFGGGNNSWRWENGQNSSGGNGNLDPGGESNKRVAAYEFKAGETYKLVVSGRSKAFRINRMVFRHTNTASAIAQNLTTPESAITGAGSSIIYRATGDFPEITGGDVDYYRDNGNDALAIAANIESNRVGFAQASRTFDGATGVYDVTITTLTEEDGESVYRLKVDGVQVGTFQNPFVYDPPDSPLDLQPHQHTWTGVYIPSGATLAIESNAATNGEIPEGAGTAWARGRWQEIELATSSLLVRPPAGRIAIVADGNSPDPDDIGATAVIFGILSRAGLHEKLVHLSHSCDLDPFRNGGNQRIDAPNELRRQNKLHELCGEGVGFFGAFPNLVDFYNCRTEQAAAVNDLRDAINASTASDPLWIVEAGEPDIIGFALQAANAAAREHVHVISHHPANDNSGDFFTWQQILDFGVREHQIGDQNVGLQVLISSGLWDWAEGHSDPAIVWILDQLKYAEADGVVGFQSNKYDCSDAGMVYWWITGANAGGNRNSTPVEIRAMLTLDPNAPAAYWPLDEGVGLIAGDVSGNGHDGSLVNFGDNLPGDGAAWRGDSTRSSYLSFDGENDRIETQFTYALGAGDDFTWAWWASKQSAAGLDGGSIMVGNRFPEGAPGERFEFIKLTPEQAQFADADGAEFIERYDYADIAEGGWNHYAMVKNGSTFQWYVNGVAQGAGVTLDYREDSPIPFLIGGDGSASPNEHFKGFIDDVILYRKALSTAEVSAVMSGNIRDEPAVVTLMLVNADTDEDIGPINHGDIIDYAAIGTRNLSVRADTSPAGVGSVVFGLDGEPSYALESVAPYALAGDTSGDYQPWTLAPGAHTLTATPYAAAGGGGAAGRALVRSFTIVDSPSEPAVISGELKKWHKVTLSWAGPSTSETAAINPFSDYRLDVTFTHGASGKSYTVPGYFAADGNAADTSAQAGNIWRAHFAADEEGEWRYGVSFRQGADVAASGVVGAGSSAGFFDGEEGGFLIGETDKSGRDLRGKGRLQYVGKHHLKFAETGEYFLKAGPDAPENFLAYEDFDDTPNDQKNQPNLRKSWSPHAGDYDAASASSYTWQGGKGTEILGAVRYLASEGLNVFSFLTFNIDGDDDNVFPHRLKSTVAAYEALADDERWDAAAGGVYHDRFDVSKMDQWGRVLDYGTQQGMYLHFKTQETENDDRMDGGALGRERRLYYRELVARYGHHLALNWNLGEENTNTTAEQRDFAQWFYDNDPYRHHVVLHTFPNAKNAVYTPLLGSASRLTGLSLQGRQATFSDVFTDTLTWVENSAAAGVPWVVAYDEPGDAVHALRPAGDEGNSWTDGRKNALWGNVMAGGAGVEFYYGYNHAESDLTAQNHRSRDDFWDYCRYMLEFFKNYEVPFQDMGNENALVSASDAWCLRKPGTDYVVYLRNGGTTDLNLGAASGDFTVRWYDPRNGGALQVGSVASVSGGGMVPLGVAPSAPSSDWVVYVRHESRAVPTFSGVMAGVAADADVRGDTGVLGVDSISLVPGKSGGGGGQDRSTVFVFQLPDFGPVAQPFTSATLSFQVEAVSDSPPGVDLYGLGKRDTPEVLPEDYYGEAVEADGTDALRIQTNLLTSTTGAGVRSSSESSALAIYLNEQYDSGGGIGSYVFLRLSTNGTISGLQRHFITSADAAGENGPRISFSTGIPEDFFTWQGAFTWPQGADLSFTGDADSDGISNWLEYLFGLDPSDGGSSDLVAAGLSQADGTFTYTRRNPQLTGFADYEVWVSENLSDWEHDAAALQTTDDTGEVQEVRVTLSRSKPLSAPVLFFRIKAPD